MRILVAGIGNLFLGDDGFGPEVVRRMLLADQDLSGPQISGPIGLPADVRLVDYGIRGMHLAYDLLDPYDALVLVDALPGQNAPGQLRVLEVGPNHIGPNQVSPAHLGTGELDPHGMDPLAVLTSVGALGGELPPTYVVGCQTENLEEGIGLSAAVDAAVPQAITAIHTLIAELLATSATVTTQRS
jgi:hydrogenase maturation protease